MTHVLVTGASGFLGRAIVHDLLNLGHGVTTLQRRPSNVPGAQDVLGSITSPADIRRALGHADAVIHLAAKVSLTGDPHDFTKVNVDGTRNLLEEAAKAGVTRFVHVSSPSVAHSGKPITGADAETANPRTARGEYARTKAGAELLALNANTAIFPVVAVRPHLVWGPGDTQLVARIIQRAHARRLPLLDHGAALIDTTYIDNAASAIIAALNRADDIGGNAYVVTNGEPRTVAELFYEMCRAAGAPRPKLRIPAKLAHAAGAAVELAWKIRPGTDEPPMTRFLAEQLSTAHWFDQRRTRTDLNWEPAVTLQEGYRRLANHYRG